jgi:hypothetical protein
MINSSNPHFGGEAGFLVALRGAAHTAMFALCKLNEIQFSAPWNPERTTCR